VPPLISDVDDRASLEAGAFAALRQRGFALFWVSAIVSNVGTWMQNVTVPFVVYEITGSTGWLFCAVVAGYLPQFIVSPLAGATADRTSRRTVLLVSMALQVVMSVGLALLWYGDVRSVSLILAAVFVSNVAAGYQLISWQAIVPSLVPRPALASAVRLNSVQYVLGRAVGPAVAGFVLAAYGPGVAFAANAVSFLGVCAVLGFLSVAEQTKREPTSIYRDLRDGLRYAHSHPVAFQAILNGALVMLFPFALVQLAPTLAHDSFRVASAGYAALLVANGIGSMIATGGLTLVGHRFRRSQVTMAGLVFTAGGAMVIGMTHLLQVGVVGFLLIGLGQSLVSVSLNTALQSQIPELYRGRVLSLYITGNIGSVPLGTFLLVGLAAFIGIAATAVVIGVLMAAYTAYAIVRFGGMRGLDSDVVSGVSCQLSGDPAG